MAQTRVGPVLHGKSGPDRTTFVLVEQFLTNKISPTRTGFDGQKWYDGPNLMDKSGPGDKFCAGPFLP